MKLSGLKNGDTFVEYGGTLQNQERIYFGPVNIKNINIQLLDEYGRVLDINNMDYSFCLTLITAYDI